MKQVFNLLVVDESGSMGIIEHQALVDINETLTTTQKMQQAHKELEQRVTLITFDSTHKKLFHDNVPNPLKSCDYNIGTDSLDVESIASGMGIDNHLQFTEDEKGTREMFARKQQSRRRFNQCMAEGCVMEAGNFIVRQLGYILFHIYLFCFYVSINKVIAFYPISHLPHPQNIAMAC